MNDWNSDVKLIDHFLQFFLQFVVLAFLGNKWNRSCGEELITFQLNFFISKAIDVNITISKMLELEVLLLP